MRLLAFGGLKGSGKDECAKPLIEQGWVHLKFADPLWQCLQALDLEVKYLGCNIKLNSVIRDLGREEAKKQVPVVRRLLERIGTEMGRGVLGEDIWVEYMANRILELPEDANIVISDCRFSNEADLVRKLGGQVILVRRPGVLQGEHRSESLDFDFDAVLQNVGTVEELYETIREMVK